MLNAKLRGDMEDYDEIRSFDGTGSDLRSL